MRSTVFEGAAAAAPKDRSRAASKVIIGDNII